MYCSTWMRGNFGLKLRNSPKFPHVHAWFHCNTNKKGLTVKRDITILPCVNKILEKFVGSQIAVGFDSRMFDNSTAYRKHHSRETIPWLKSWLRHGGRQGTRVSLWAFSPLCRFTAPHWVSLKRVVSRTDLYHTSKATSVTDKGCIGR